VEVKFTCLSEKQVGGGWNQYSKW